MNIFKIDETVKVSLTKLYSLFPNAVDIVKKELERAVDCQTKLLFELYHLLDELEVEQDPDIIWNKLRERVGSMLSIALDKKTPGQLLYEANYQRFPGTVPYSKLNIDTKKEYEEKGKALFDAYEANKIK